MGLINGYLTVAKHSTLKPDGCIIRDWNYINGSIIIQIIRGDINHGLYHRCTDYQLYIVKWLGTLRKYPVI